MYELNPEDEAVADFMKRWLAAHEERKENLERLFFEIHAQYEILFRQLSGWPKLWPDLQTAIWRSNTLGLWKLHGYLQYISIGMKKESAMEDYQIFVDNHIKNGETNWSVLQDEQLQAILR